VLLHAVLCQYVVFSNVEAIMVRKKNRKANVKVEPSAVPDPILVHCLLRVPRDEADSVLPRLGLAFGCGGAVMRKTRTIVEVEADLEIRTVGDIVEKGVPVLVTKRIPVAPVPANELIADAAAWFKQIRRLA
jgi:hypothetical protein